MWTENWHLLAHRSELSRSREFVRFDVLGREVVLYNDGASVIAFDNRCPHRGARIFDGDNGCERFVCRYHGWSYAKGKVFSGQQEALPGCPGGAIELNTFACQWIGDFAFVSPQPTHSLAEQLGEITELVEALSYGIGHRCDFNRFVFEADWRIALDNALEPYHVANIHPGTLGTLQLEPGENRFFGYNSIWSAPLGNGRTARQLKGLTRLFDLPHQFLGYESLYLFPFTMISSTYGFSQSLQHYLPSAISEQTHFTSRMFSGRLAATTKPELVSSFLKSSAEMNRAVFEEDHAICRRVAADTWSSHPPAFLAASEEKLLHFRNSYRDALGLPVRQGPLASSQSA